MSRLARKNWTGESIGFITKGGMLDMFDNEIKTFLRINDVEMDYLCEFATDEEMDLIVKPSLTFAEKRMILNLLHTKVYGKV